MDRLSLRQGSSSLVFHVFCTFPSQVVPFALASAGGMGGRNRPTGPQLFVYLLNGLSARPPNWDSPIPGLALSPFGDFLLFRWMYMAGSELCKPACLNLS